MTRSKEQDVAMAWLDDALKHWMGPDLAVKLYLPEIKAHIQQLEVEVEMLRAERGNYTDKDAIRVLVEQRDALLADSANLRQKMFELESQLVSARVVGAMLSGRVAELEAMTAHPYKARHYKAEDGSMKLTDTCGQCGLDQRDSIHAEAKP